MEWVWIGKSWRRSTAAASGGRAASSSSISTARTACSRRRRAPAARPSGVRRLVNHQSCEGAGHDARAHLMLDEGPERYHDRVCAEIGARAGGAAVMGTAASMHYVAVVARARRRRRGDRDRHRRRAEQRDVRRRSGALARERRRRGPRRRPSPARSTRCCVISRAADRAGAGARRGHDDRSQERGADAPRHSEPRVRATWRPAPAPTSTASPRRSARTARRR